MPVEPESARVSGQFPVEILTVSALNRNVRDLLEHRYPLLWVAGEISNFTRAKSGHWYFSLKDQSAQVRCVMFKHRALQVAWEPREGMQVEVRALVTLYEARGDFQLGIESMRHAGQGALFEAFVRLRDRLSTEGLFDEGKKRPLPAYPRAIGVVTSLAAAALHDILTTLTRRNPSIPVVIYPAMVQGEGAVAELCRAVRTASQRRECDVLILARGGGSIEDLWAFNDESLARAIRACTIPVVTGIGHETDFTIADFAADRRAPTPTAAAELVAPARSELMHRLVVVATQLRFRMVRNLENRMQLLDQFTRRLTSPGRRLALQMGLLAHLRRRLIQAGKHIFEQQDWRLRQLVSRSRHALPRPAQLNMAVLESSRRAVQAWKITTERAASRLVALATSLDHLGPMAVLQRGYTLVQNERGEIVRDSARVAIGDVLSLRFARGRAETVVRKKD
jgi:exodeoxyribonuclease VII large subunit